MSLLNWSLSNKSKTSIIYSYVLCFKYNAAIYFSSLDNFVMRMCKYKENIFMPSYFQSHCNLQFASFVYIVDDWVLFTNRLGVIYLTLQLQIIFF